MYLAFRNGYGSAFRDVLGKFPNIQKTIFCSSSSLHALVCMTLLMFVLLIYLSHICHLKFIFSKLKSIVFKQLHFLGKIEPLRKVKESNQMGKNLLISYLSYFVRHKPPHQRSGIIDYVGSTPK